jgi:hypothetical protein
VGWPIRFGVSVETFDEIEDFLVGVHFDAAILMMMEKGPGTI